jgi:hypothetical protein
MTQPAVHEDIAVATTLERALDPLWLAQALVSVGKGAAVTEVTAVEILRTMATKVRFTLRFAGDDTLHAFCLKAFLDTGDPALSGGSTTVLEADFYAKIAPQVSVRVPECVAAIIDRQAPLGVIIMRDLVAGGARFCSALEAFTADEAAQSLDQLAALHSGRELLATSPWIGARVAQLANMTHFTPAMLQELLDGPRGVNLTPAVRDAARLIAGLKEMANRDAQLPQFLVHGDAHAGNIYRTMGGEAGLIDWQLLQSGGWALDVAYHICAVLPPEVAALEERKLLAHYLGVMRGQGFAMPDDDEAWRQYRQAAIYGYYLWSITRRVDPPVIIQFVDRLGKAVMRHESHSLLGIA